MRGIIISGLQKIIEHLFTGICYSELYKRFVCDSIDFGPYFYILSQWNWGGGVTSRTSRRLVLRSFILFLSLLRQNHLSSLLIFTALILFSVNFRTSKSRISIHVFCIRVSESLLTLP